MAELSSNERASVAIYELQTFLIEQAVKPKEVSLLKQNIINMFYRIGTT